MDSSDLIRMLLLKADLMPYRPLDKKVHMWTRRALEAEIREKTADLEAFTKAREIIRNRVVEVKDSSCALTPLPEWSGTDAVLGSLDLSIHAIERTLVELNGLLKEMGPYLKLVTPDEDLRS